MLVQIVQHNQRHQQIQIYHQRHHRHQEHHQAIIQVHQAVAIMVEEEVVVEAVAAEDLVRLNQLQLVDLK